MIYSECSRDQDDINCTKTAAIRPLSTVPAFPVPLPVPVNWGYQKPPESPPRSAVSFISGVSRDLFGDRKLCSAPNRVRLLPNNLSATSSLLYIWLGKRPGPVSTLGITNFVIVKGQYYSKVACLWELG